MNQLNFLKNNNHNKILLCEKFLNEMDQVILMHNALLIDSAT